MSLIRIMSVHEGMLMLAGETLHDAWLDTAWALGCYQGRVADPCCFM